MIEESWDIMAIINLAKQKKEKYELPKEGGLIPSVEIHEIHAYPEIKYDLIYATDEEVLNSEFVHVYVRREKSVLFRFIFCEKLSALKKIDLSNENLKKYASNRSFERLEMKDFDLSKMISIYMFNEPDNKEEVKKYCFLNAKVTKNEYAQYFIYDDKVRVLRSYRELKTFGRLYDYYKTALYFDLAIPNKEY